MVAAARSESIESSSSTASSTSTPPSNKKVGTTISMLTLTSMPTPATTATLAKTVAQPTAAPGLSQKTSAGAATAKAESTDGKKGESNPTMEFEEPASNVVSSNPEVLNTQEEDKRVRGQPRG
jgi:hypothetical protein